MPKIVYDISSGSAILGIQILPTHRDRMFLTLVLAALEIFRPSPGTKLLKKCGWLCALILTSLNAQIIFILQKLSLSLSLYVCVMIAIFMILGNTDIKNLAGRQGCSTK